MAAGRLGASLAVALVEAGRNVVAVSSRRAEQREWLRDALAQARAARRDASRPDAGDGDQIDDRARPQPVIAVVSQPSEAAALAQVVFVTASDGAIAEVARSCRLAPMRYVAHCSGLLGAEVLGAAAPESIVGAMHPLQTFPNRASHRLLRRVSFGIESPDADFRGWLARLATTFEGRVVPIGGGPAGARQRAAYHAAAVMSCGLLAGLAGVAADLWTALGMSRDDALTHMAPMITSTADAVAELGVPGALSGPFVRGDVETVRAHLSATATVGGADVSRAYAALALAQLPLASAHGELPPETQDALRTLLENHLRSL